jgi:multiple sugar transport system permease protein
VSGYGIFFFRQFFLSIPPSLEDAAMLDGCNMWQMYLKIFLPMASTPMVIIGVGTFMGHWNSFTWPSLVIVSNTRITQITQLIRMMSAIYASDYGVVIAAVVMASIVPIALFAVLQKKIVGGIAISGLN